MNLDNIGISTVKDSTAFKKIQFFSKTNPTNLYNVKSDFQNSFDKLNNFYLTDLSLNQSYTYGMDRQHSYTSLTSSLPNYSTVLDNKSVSKFFEYNLDSKLTSSKNSMEVNRLSYSHDEDSSNESLLNNYQNLINNTLPS
jgi:hypothetical protein